MVKEGKQEKRFAVSGILYTLLLLFLLLVVTGMNHLLQKQTLLNQIKKEVEEKWNPKEVPIEFTVTYDYTGASQTFTVPYDGVYQIELWGASGGIYNAGNGAYTKGEILLKKGSTFYFYVGSNSRNATGGYNGGGSTQNPNSHGGGGATDMRLTGGEWNNVLGLRSRIMVAGGGGATSYACSYAGGLVGYDGKAGNTYFNYQGKGANQIAGGATPSAYSCGGLSGQAGGFGFGGSGGRDGQLSAGGSGGTGGGSGYYGGSGASGGCNTSWAGGGGSSYISGHIGCVAITSETDQTPKVGCTTGTSDSNCSIHYSNYQFSNTVMIDGAGYRWTNVKGEQQAMPNPEGGEYPLGKGHLGNGVVRITLLI